MIVSADIEPPSSNDSVFFKRTGRAGISPRPSFRDSRRQQFSVSSVPKSRSRLRGFLLFFESFLRLLVALRHCGIVRRHHTVQLGEIRRIGTVPSPLKFA